MLSSNALCHHSYCASVITTACCTISFVGLPLQVVDPALHSEIDAIEKGTEGGDSNDTRSCEAKASEMFKSICAVADIALLCTAREPRKRPNMGDVVAMLLPHVQQWRPQVRMR